MKKTMTAMMCATALSMAVAGCSGEADTADGAEEETGYRAGQLENLGRFCSSPGMTSETFTLLKATELTRVGPGGGTEHENITVHRVALADMADFITQQRDAGCIIDVRIVMLLSAGWL